MSRSEPNLAQKTLTTYLQVKVTGLPDPIIRDVELFANLVINKNNVVEYGSRLGNDFLTC